MFELQPTLQGDLLLVRPLGEADFPELFRVASDPLIWELHPNNDRWQEPVFREFLRGAMESGGAFAVLDRRTGHIIGSSRYHGYDAASGEIEIGWTFLARSCWGGAHNAELKRLMLRHAFRFVQRVVFLVGPGNVRSQRALEKIGAVRAGSRRDANGRESVLFLIAARDFQS